MGVMILLLQVLMKQQGPFPADFGDGM